jgi:hypothetical protein
MEKREQLHYRLINTICCGYCFKEVEGIVDPREKKRKNDLEKKSNYDPEVF